MVRKGWVALLVAAALSAPVSVGAQSTLFLRTIVVGSCLAGTCPASLLSVEPDAWAIRRTSPASATTGMYVTPDGALMVSLGRTAAGSFLMLRDLASGAETAVPLTGSVDQMVGNPTRPEVYVSDSAGGLALSMTGIRRLAMPACGIAGVPQAMAISADGGRVAYSCLPSSGNLGYTAVLDTATGGLLTALGPGTGPAVALSPDGAVLYQLEFVSPDMHLRRYLTSTGALDGDVVLPGGDALAVEPRTGRVFASSLGAIYVVDGTTLAAQPAEGCFAPIRSIVFDRDRPRAFVASAPAIPTGFRWLTYVCEIDTAALTRTRHVMYSALDPAPALAMTQPPLAVTGLVATVSGATVGLSWTATTPAASVTRYLLEAGTAPGLANIATFDTGLQTSFSASAVPPGTYYVRVRAANHAGVSAPSNEVVVQVP